MVVVRRVFLFVIVAGMLIVILVLLFAGGLFIVRFLFFKVCEFFIFKVVGCIVVGTAADSGLATSFFFDLVRLFQLVYLAWLPAGPAGLLPDVVRWS